MGNAPGEFALVPPAFNNAVWRYINGLTCSTNGVNVPQKNQAHIYPNPVESGQSVQFVLKDIQLEEIKCLDINGREIEIVKNNDNNTFQFNQVKPGVYYLTHSKMSPIKLIVK